MTRSPLAILDVDYRETGALAAAVVARDWGDATACEERVARIAEVGDYVPGRFYLRELPCLLRVLAALQTAVEVVVVDGYVHLDATGAPGLGAHLHAALGGARPVVGVAKTAFQGSDFAARVHRGGSARPLFVTALGLPLDEATRLVAGMHGAHRIPTLLTRVDQLARGSVQPRALLDPG